MYLQHWYSHQLRMLFTQTKFLGDKIARKRYDCEELMIATATHCNSDTWTEFTAVSKYTWQLATIFSHCFNARTSTTRNTQRAQISLAEADHCSHNVHCTNVEPCWWKANPKGSGSLPSPRSGYATAIMVFFFYSFTHLRIPRSPLKLLSSLLYYPGPLHKISFQSIYNFLSNVVHKLTNKQTNQRYQKHNLICQKGNKAIYI